jgi:crotonobetainyl-CoA:carnitine CoA-transferase CaiB-like acyl-CoA transferase
MNTAAAAPLAGVRVVELGQVLAGPFAGAILADLGAEVVKVERVEGGDDARRMGPAYRHGDALNLAMLHRRAQTGRGGMLQTSLLETALVWNGQKSDAYLNEGRLPERHRSGHPGFVPYEAFDTADGPLLICCGNDRLFAKLAEVLDQRQWLDDERFAMNRARLAHKAEMLAELAPLLKIRSRAEWAERFEAAGVPCAPLNSVPQALDDPQVQALGLLAHVPGEDFRLTASPLSFDGQRPAITASAPRLGEHNAHYGLPEFVSV